MFSYQEALDYLYSFVDYSATRLVKYSAQTFDLSRMTALLGLLGNPHQRFLSLHVAGTKGKGSVAALCASALAAAGYRTGCYTSPHLQDFCERVQVDGRLIAPAELADIVDGLRALAPQVPGITTFELTTALAFAYFARRAVEVAVVEVGLGGRLDATNVLTPLVSVITSLSYDHMDLLGPTLSAIAGEKAGIIKPGVPVVISPQEPEALTVLERVATERGAPLTVVGRDWHVRPVAHTLDGQTLEVWSAEEERQANALRAAGYPAQWRPTRLELPLLGAHQVENAATAYAALQALRARALPLAAEAIRAGLGQVHWPGRFEILRRRPYVVVDGAHNRDSARRLAAALDDYFPGRRVLLVFGASADKDIAGMLAELGPRLGRLIVTQAVHPRALEPEQIIALLGAGAAGLPMEACAPVAAALRRALELAGPDEVVLACGSLFVAAEVRAAQAALTASG
jgi:dihydrofolate synthase/folylpolyglutamate synthase